MVTDKQCLQAISFYAGNRFDLVQAGGGNTSAKISDNEMLVKASGINLSEITEKTGYVSVNFQSIRQFLSGFDFTGLTKKEREEHANHAMQESKLSEKGRPSIETFLHALLSKHTLHTHPISINILTSQKNWKDQLKNIWPDAIFVPYHTPGIDLALAMSDEMNAYTAKNGHYPKVAFLQNHGLIISSDNPEEVIRLTEEVTQIAEDSLSINLTRYRNVSLLQETLSKIGINDTSMICNDDHVIQQGLAKENKESKIWPFCPDTLIYCGVRPVYLDHAKDSNSIKKYMDAYQESPKVLILNGTVYFCAISLNKAKEAQDLFKFHLMVIEHSTENTQRLKLSEVAYLSNWDAEKFRQGV